MAFVSGCGRAPDAPSSSAAVAKAGSDSPRRVRPYRPLRGRGAFTRVYRVGRRIRRGDVTVVTSSEGAGLPLVGLVAGKRVGNAVERNRAKRRMREAMARVPLEHDTVYVVIAGPGVNEADFDRLVDWLQEASDAGSADAGEEDA